MTQQSKLDILLVELWSQELRYQEISDNLGIASLKASLDEKTNLSTGMINSERLYFHDAQRGDPITLITDYASSYYEINKNLVIGVSSTQWRLKELHSLVVLLLQRHPKITIIAGGYGPTFSASEVLDFGISSVCIGEGDETILELIKCYEGTLSFPEVKGVAYKSHGKTMYTSPRDLVDVTKIPPPSLDYINGRSLFENEYTYSNRGCCYECDFCFIHRFYKKGIGKPWRQKSADQLYQEYRNRAMNNPNLRVIGHADDNFLVKAGFLYQLKDYIKNDELLINLRISFPAGACEINRHWRKIEENIEIIKFIELGYESTVRSFLERQKKGARDQNMVPENIRAVTRLQKAKKKHRDFNYEVYHLIADRHTTLEELAEIYPQTEDFDKVEWVIKILQNGSNVVMYFDKRDTTYPMFIMAYVRIFDELCKHAKILDWLCDSYIGGLRRELQQIFENAFITAYEMAKIVYDRFQRTQGEYKDICDELRDPIESKCKDIYYLLHKVSSSALINHTKELFEGRALSELASEIWLNGYTSRLAHTLYDREHKLPSYVELYMHFFNSLETRIPVIERHREFFDRDSLQNSIFSSSIITVMESAMMESARHGFQDVEALFFETACADIDIIIEELIDTVSASHESA